MLPPYDPSRRWTRDLALLEKKAVRAGVQETESTLGAVLRQSLDACTGLVRDLTGAALEQKRLLAAANAADSAWDRLFDKIPCPCVVTDTVGSIQQANAAAAALLAISARHLETRQLAHFAEDRALFARVLQQVAWDRVEVCERISIRPRDRAVVEVDLLALTRMPDDNTALLWFLRPVAK